MVSDKKRYAIRERTINDKQKSTFDSHGWFVKPAPQSKTEFTAANVNVRVYCPFCLYEDKLQAFLISNKEGISQGKALCPDCNNSMMMKSLYNDWTTKQYAEWVFNYRRSGFWQKCPHDKWKKRLFAAGMVKEFWDTYKELQNYSEVDHTFDRLTSTEGSYQKAYDAYAASPQTYDGKQPCLICGKPAIEGKSYCEEHY